MKRKRSSPFEKDTIHRIFQDSAFAEVFLEELMGRPLAVQASFFRRLKGLTQKDLAEAMKINQGFLSRLENPQIDHLVSIYARYAKAIKARLAFLPEGARVVFSTKTTGRMRTAA
jgi:hypothetical protein